MSKIEPELLRVGELAKAAGKTVRAIHLYEELGLLRPAMRTDGGFRLYHPEARNRIAWIVKLQAVGFKLSEIQGFIRDFEHAPSGRQATDHVRQVFSRKLHEIRQQITQLEIIENDIHEALEYLDSCHDCSPTFSPSECSVCDHQGHERGSAPQLFASLSRTVAEDLAELTELADLAGPGAGAYDVAVDEPRDARPDGPAHAPGESRRGESN